VLLVANLEDLRAAFEHRRGRGFERCAAPFERFRIENGINAREP